MNTIILVGVVQAGYQEKPAVETATTQGGANVSKFKLKVPRKGGDEGKGGDFFTVKAWRNLSDRVASELRAGQRVAVQGAITNDRWKNKDDQWQDAWTVHATDFQVVAGDAPATGGSAPAAKPAPQQQEEIPF